MTPAYCQPINFIKVYKFAIFLAQDQNRSAYGAARMKGAILFPRKENGPPYTPQEKGIRLAVSDLNGSYASGMGMPARGGAALSVAIRFDLLLSSAAALPILYKYRLISVYQSANQCGERSKAAFGKQSAAKQSSLAPHDSKARLLNVSNRSDSWRSHVHRT